MEDKILREELLKLLGGYSHMSFDEALESFPTKSINTAPPGVAYTFWHLLEHIRFTQRDLLNYILLKNYEEPSWPKDYWPQKDKKATKALWNKTIKEYKNDLERLKKIVKDPKTNLFSGVPTNPSHTIFRAIILVGDHCSYHLGEFATWRQISGNWPKGRRG